MTLYISRFIKRYRRSFIVFGCLLIFFAGTWAGRSSHVKRITAYFGSYLSLSRHDVTQTVTKGVTHRQIKQGGLCINILEILPDAPVLIRPYRALDAGIGTESLVSLARRHKAVAAVNGGYFEMTGTFQGESVGALKINGEWISEPEQERAALGLSTVDGQIEAAIDQIELSVELIAPNGETVAVDGINRGRIDDELILYRPIFHRVTLTDADGIEVVVRNRSVTEIYDGRGNSPIPLHGYVLSANHSKRDWLRSRISIQDTVTVREIVYPKNIGNQLWWERAEHIISGGPLLIRDGVATTAEEQDSEGFDRRFYGWWHPRTAVYIKADRTLAFVTITAANPKVRRGMRLSQLANLLLEWGAKDALNLDGGGSTMMVINGEIVSTRLPPPPKPKTAQGNRRIRATPQHLGRPIADAFLILLR